MNTYGFMSSSIHSKPLDKVSKEVVDFENAVRAALGLSPTAVKPASKDVTSNSDEETPGPQTEKALEVKATIDKALQQVQSNFEAELFEKEIRDVFNLK